MLGRRRWLLISIVAALTVSGIATTAGADASSESGFLAKINAERSAAGLGALQMDGGLQAWARQHTQIMIDGGCPDGQNICHSTSAQLQAAAGTGWSMIGENVGRGGDVNTLHATFMGSPPHKANILKAEYNYVGIGTGQGDGRLYVTVVFMAKGSTSAPQPPATTTPKPATTTAPKPATTTTTTTTLPPTTTTTLIVGPDKVVTPGESCPVVTRLWWTCHD